MKKLLAGLFLTWLGLVPVQAANVNIDALPAASSVAGADLLECEQTGVNNKCTATQTAAFIYGLMSGDATASGLGAVTFATVNGNVGSFGGSTSCLSITATAKGLITAAAAFTCTPAIANVTGMGTGVATFLATPTSANLAAALTDETGTGAAVFAGSPALTGTPTAPTATLGTNTTQLATTAFVIANASGSSGVSSIAGNTGAFTLNATSGITNSTNDIILSQASASQFGAIKVDGTTIKAASGVISAPPIVTSRTITGATDTILAGDLGNVVYYNSASAIAVTQPAPSGSFAAGFFTTLCNINAGVPTVTPGSGTIGGASTYPVPIVGTAAAPKCISYQSDGTNFNLIPSSINSFAGTATLGTSAIASGACATVVTVSAAGVLTTDVVTFGYNSDPTAVTGYGASATGAVLSVYPYPTANNVNVKVCNSSSASITPSAMTLNWSVKR